MFHKNKFLLVDCSESGKYCFCTSVSPSAHGWLVTSGRQACLPPWALVVEVGFMGATQKGRVALETIQERIGVISGVKEELCQMD